MRIYALGRDIFRMSVQVQTEMWRFPDRTTEIGQMINSYLGSEKNVDDAAIHLLFSANRWEKRYTHAQCFA
jgi:thymidylate kinase